MGFTNKTPRLRLPQWIGKDKPTFQGDMNEAFAIIENAYAELSQRLDDHQTQINTLQNGRMMK